MARVTDKESYNTQMQLLFFDTLFSCPSVVFFVWPFAHHLGVCWLQDADRDDVSQGDLVAGQEGLMQQVGLQNVHDGCNSLLGCILFLHAAHE